MIKKLQKKFILITMISVVIVLAVIMSAINIMNYAEIRSNVDMLLDTLADNDGRFAVLERDDKLDIFKPEEVPEMDKSNDKRKPDILGLGDRNHMNEETPYETRFFSVLVKDGSIVWTNTGNIASIDSEQANEYALDIIEKGRVRGYADNYRYLVSEKDNGTLVIAIDCRSRLATANAFLKASVLISVLGTLAFLILVVLLSYQVTRPIASTYEKQKRFVTDSSHEIKTPLAVISANTEVIEMINGESEWTDSIRNQVERLTALTVNLTALARMDEDAVKITKAEFNISDAVSDVLGSFQVLAESKNIRLTSDIEEGIILNGEERGIRQLASILFDNACKYSAGEIRVTLKKSKNKVKFGVYNTATDVDAGNLDHYFDRFYRADASRSKDIEGFGIGLSIARSIVELHKGTITAKSDDGASVQFMAVLPL